MRNRRQFIISGSVAIATAVRNARDVFAAQNSGGRLCLGLNGLNYYIGYCPFLNWQKMASPYEVTLASGEKLSGKAAFDRGYVDSFSGEIMNPVPSDAIAFTRLFYALPGPGNIAGGYNLSEEQWTIKWDGAGLCTIGGLGVGSSQEIDNSAASGTFRFGTHPGNTWAKFTITNSNNPPRNVRIYQTRYASNVAKGEKFNPDWIRQIRNFGILRLMDWMATNNSVITDFAQIADEQYFAWGQGLTMSSQYGPKGGTPLSLICDLANITRCNIHFCIPHLASDECVLAIARFFRDHIDPGIVLTFEYSNECWNFGFQQTAYCRAQGQRNLPHLDPGAWYGYRSAQCMSLIQSIYDDRTRWRGCLATQTVNPDVTKIAIAGITYFIAHDLPAAKPAAITDLFDEVAITGYFGDIQQPSRRLNKISNGNSAIVTSPSHGYRTGQRLKLFVYSGMTELDNTFVTVGEVTQDTFALDGIDSTRYSTSVTDNRNYAHPAPIFVLMDVSAAKSLSDPARYPTKYDYFNQTLAQSWLSGTAEGFATAHSIASLREVFWPAQKAIADEHSLDLRQYEGGLHFLGDIFLAGYGGNPQFTDYLIHVGYAKETGAVYAAMYSAYFQIGGHYPAKFVEAGSIGPYGTWAGVRFIPGDEANPVWSATRKANESD